MYQTLSPPKSLTITENEVINSMNLITANLDEYNRSTTSEKVAANILESYMDKGEFDGTLESAITCLNHDGYTVEMES